MLFCECTEGVIRIQVIRKSTLAWLPLDLLSPFLYLSACSMLVTGLILTPSFHMYLQSLWWWLPWNIFLAGLPLFFALCALWVSHRGSRLWAWPFWSLWLLFYPNSPYMLTNLIHLNRYEFLYQGQFSGEPALWFVFLLLITGIAVGCGFGALSLIIVKRRIAATHGVTWSWVAVAGASLLSGMAIWIGRVLRFNTWDILFRPLCLINNVLAQFSWNAWLTCMLFAIMSAGVYLLVNVFPHERS